MRRSLQEQVKDATIFGDIYLDRYGREKPLKEEVSSLSKSLYKTVPAIVKDSIDLTFANDVSEPMANAEVL